MKTNSDVIRVLQIVEELAPAGTETWLINVLRKIDRRRFKLDFLVHRAQPAAYDAEAEVLGSRILRCGSPRRPVSYARRFKTLVRQHGQYDIVHSHVHHFSGVIMRLSASVIPVRIAHSHTTADADLSLEHNPVRRAYLRCMKAAIRRYSTDRLAASGAAAAALFGPEWRNDRRCRLLHCGVQLDECSAEIDKRSEFGIPRHAWVIAHVGRFEEPKNHEFLYAVAREVIRRDASAHFLLIGDGTRRERFVRQLVRDGVALRFTLLQHRTDVAAILANASDAFVFPSRYEGLGLALVEAQAAGLHCLFTESLPGEVSVVPQLCHRMSLEASPSEWAERLLRIKSFGRLDISSARQAVSESTFSIDYSVRSLEDLYASAA